MRATFLKSLLLTAAVALTSGAGAAIVVGPSGSGLQTFDALPGVTEWSTLSVAGGSADVLDTTAFETAIQLLDATTITTVLGSSATLPPSQNAVARWNSAGFYLQTRPTGNSYTVLMATLQNGTGGSVSDLTISYDWDQKNPPPVNESVAGHQV